MSALLCAAVLDFVRRLEGDPRGHMLTQCAACGDRSINNLSVEIEPGFANCSRGGIVLEILCGRGHRWQLRLSNWFMPPEYAAAMKEKFQQEMARPDPPKVAHIRAKMRRGKKLPDKIKWKGDETLDFGGL